MELVSKSYNFFLIFPIFHFSGVLPIVIYHTEPAVEEREEREE